MSAPVAVTPGTAAAPPTTPSTARALRVLMVVPSSFFGDYGGHIRILEETLALQARGHQITIITYYKGRDLPGIDIRRTRPLPWRADYEVGSSRHKLAFDIYLAAAAWRLARQLRPDVIHGHMHEGALIGGLVARRLGAPLIFDFQGSLTAEMVDHGFIDPSGAIYPWAYRLERFISRRLPQAVLTSSERGRSLLAGDFGVAAGRITALPDCVDVDRFDGQASGEDQRQLRARLGIPAGRPVVAYLGLLADYQGIPDLLRAAQQLKAAGRDVHFLIMGYPRVEYYRALAGQFGVADRVTLPGKVLYDDAPLYLSLGDVAVSAKQSKTEGSGKVLNYMALGQPVVAYDTAVHREYLGDCGVYAPPGDATALAEAIGALLDDPARRARLGRALRARAERRYSWAAAAEAIEGVYRRVLAEI